MAKTAEEFQFLIGTIQTITPATVVDHIVPQFQFLIGTIQTRIRIKSFPNANSGFNSS